VLQSKGKDRQLSVDMEKQDKREFETLRVSLLAEHVLNVELHRPNALNALNQQLWTEIGRCFKEITNNSDVRVVILSAAGRLFTAGLDLKEAASSLNPPDQQDVARKALKFKQLVDEFQASFSAIERCAVPVIAAIHSGCIGGGIDLITACDIRLCSKDAWFCVKEVDIGMAADVGTLQRLPKVVGNQAWVREVCFTGRNFNAEEAKQQGLVTRVSESKEAVLHDALSLAKVIASKSPVAVVGIKEALMYARDHTVEDSLRQIRYWNMSQVQTQDIPEAIQSFFSKKVPNFSKL